MKKLILLLGILLNVSFAKGDVIFYPRQITLLSYSTELIGSFEQANNAKNSTCLWGGIGCVGSFYYMDQPTLGFELAIEQRHYFKADQFRNFFISAYIGTAFMTDYKYISDFGIVPGIKINYKIQTTPKTVLEPYISLSVPIVWDTDTFSSYVALPVITIGVRFGLCILKTKKD